jgi:hypothetical protein
VVTTPNLKGLDAAILREAGLRATPSVFRGYCCSPMTDALPGPITGTNLEVI